jgi:hypothetical protein
MITTAVAAGTKLNFSISQYNKVKIVPLPKHHVKKVDRGVGVKLHAFLSSTLAGREESASCSSRFALPPVPIGYKAECQYEDDARNQIPVVLPTVINLMTGLN